MKVLRLLLACWFILIALSSGLAQAQQNVADWTVMVYIAADNDLERYAAFDLNEMERVGSTAAVNVVAQVDGLEGGVRRLLVMHDSAAFEVTSPTVQTLDEINTGEPSALVDFAAWVIRNYPAERYALVLWDHGGGWQGFAYDATAQHDSLSMAELGGALALITQELGRPLDLIGFDACLMGQLEVFNAIAPYGRYAVASEELIPGNGWDYQGILRALNADPPIDVPAVGRAAVDSFMRFYSRRAALYSLSVIDLARVGDVTRALGHFARAVSANPTAVAGIIGDARKNTPVFGSNGDIRAADQVAAADLTYFMNLVADLSPNAQIAAAARQVTEAAAQMVIYHRASDPLADSRGVAIFFPRSKALYELQLSGGSTRASLYARLAPLTLSPWLSFLDAYFRAALAETPPQVGVTGVAASGGRAVVDVRVAGQDVADVSVAVTRRRSDGPPEVLGYLPVAAPMITTTGGATMQVWPDGVSEQAVAWTPQQAFLWDGETEAPVMFAPSSLDPRRMTVDGLYLPALAEEEAVPAQLICNLARGTCRSLWVFLETPTGVVPFEAIAGPGDRFEPLRFLLGEGGALEAVPSGVLLIFGENGLSLYARPVPSGDYRFNAVGEDFGGGVTVMAASAEIALDDSGEVSITEIDLTPEDESCSDVDEDGYCDDDAEACPDADGDGICDDEEGCADTDFNGICDDQEDGCLDADANGICEDQESGDSGGSNLGGEDDSGD